MDGASAVNPFLAGNFAPIRTEDDFELAVTGEIPCELFRNGPNPQFEPLDPNYHWFYGDGMIQGADRHRPCPASGSIWLSW